MTWGEIPTAIPVHPAPNAAVLNTTPAEYLPYSARPAMEATLADTKQQRKDSANLNHHLLPPKKHHLKWHWSGVKFGEWFGRTMPSIYRYRGIEPY